MSLPPAVLIVCPLSSSSSAVSWSVRRSVLPYALYGDFYPHSTPSTRAALRWRRSQVPGYCFPLAKGRARRSGSYCVQSLGWVCVYGEMEIRTAMFPLTPPSPSSILLNDSETYHQISIRHCRTTPDPLAARMNEKAVRNQPLPLLQIAPSLISPLLTPPPRPPTVMLYQCQKHTTTDKPREGRERG